MTLTLSFVAAMRSLAHGERSSCMEHRRGVRGWTIGAMAIALFIGFAPAAHGFELVDWDWSFQKQPVEGRFVFCNANAPAGASQAIRDAAAKWNYAKFRFSFDADACPASPPQNYVEFGAVKEVAAVTDFPNEPGTKKMKKCTIRFNSAKDWYVGSGLPSKTQSDLFSVALHEFGHCVGLADVQTPGVVMRGTLLPGETVRDLKPDDIAGRNKIYGAP
jgi:hypothetical protein